MSVNIENQRIKPKFCEEGFYNFDIKAAFEKNQVILTSQLYYNAKFKYADYLFKCAKQFTKDSLISHDIWFTNPENPKQISDKNIEFLKNKISIMDQENSNWEHILWTNCASCIDQTKERLKNVNIKILDTNNIPELSDINGHLIKLVNKGFFGIAKDLLQPKLLAQYGGVYSDLNFILFKSPAYLFETYDFFIHTLPGYGFNIMPSMVGSSKLHPIITNTLDKLLSSIDEALEIKEVYPDCDIYNLTLISTYIPFLISFYKYSNMNNTFDIAINPNIHEVLYNIKQRNFSNEVVKQILSDFDFNNLTCVNTNEYKKYEEFLLRYEDQEFSIPYTLLGVDIGENSWFE